MTSSHDIPPPDTGAEPGDEQQVILDHFQELFAQSPPPPIKLTNIYKELPITHPAEICDVRGRHLELTTSDLQLAAISQCNEVFLRVPRFANPVLGRMHSIDVRRGLVQLADFSFAEVHADNRATIRVRLRKPTNVIIHASSNRISGVIHDISLGGCCVHTLICKGLSEQEPAEVELKVIDTGTGLPNCTRIPGSIVNILGDSAPFRCIMRFLHNQQSEQFLSLLINQRQHEILKELRETL